jgi:hypothetical protein
MASTVQNTWMDCGICIWRCAKENKSAPSAGVALPTAWLPSSAGPAALREGQGRRPLPLPAVGGSPPRPQHVFAASRLPCSLQTHTDVFGPMGCADAHLGLQGSHVVANTSPADGLAPPSCGWVPPAVLTDGLPPPARRVPPMHLAAHSTALPGLQMVAQIGRKVRLAR